MWQVWTNSDAPLDKRMDGIQRPERKKLPKRDMILNRSLNFQILSISNVINHVTKNMTSKKGKSRNSSISTAKIIKIQNVRMMGAIEKR